MILVKPTVVTELSFDQTQSTPRLLFKPIGVVDQNTYNHIVEMSKSEEVQMIIGAVPFTSPAKPVAVPPPKNEVEQAADNLIKTVLEPEKPKAKTVETSGSLEDALDNIGFDD